MFIETYRVEKDGVSFYVQKETLKHYEDEGYSIFKSFEQRIDADENVISENEDGD